VCVFCVGETLWWGAGDFGLQMCYCKLVQPSGALIGNSCDFTVQRKVSPTRGKVLHMHV
jgi:hypothetical protein